MYRIMAGMLENFRFRNRLTVFIMFAVMIGSLVAGSIFASQNPDQASDSASSEAGNFIYFPIIHVSKPELTDLFDMARFMIGDGRLYEVQTFQGPQTRFQTQTEDVRFFHTKGIIDAEWEELWATDQHIMRGTDTSPGSGYYYTLRDPSIYGSAWSPRYWRIGDVFERNPLVTFYRKDNCTVPDEIKPGWHKTYLRFEAYYQERLFESGKTLNNVVEFTWLLELDGDPIEKYYYAENYGLVGWWSNDRSFSYFSEEHAPGSRDDSIREVISCLDTGALVNWRLAKLLYGPLESPYRVK